MSRVRHARCTGWRILLTLVAATASAACGESGPESRSVTVTDSAGATIVVSRAPRWSEGEGWRLSETPVLSIGAIEAPDPAVEFSRIAALTRLSDGRVVVLDSEAAEVRWFDAEGNHLKTMGGKGEGPGEFNYASSAFRMDGDTILVEDRPRIRHVLFDESGELVRTDVMDYDAFVGMGPWVECLSQSLPDGSLLMCKPEAGQPEARADPGPGHHRSYSRFVRLPFDLSMQDTMGLYGGLEQWGVSHGGRTRFAIHPFHARTHTASAADPLRVAIARGPEYSIEVWTLDGLERIVRRAGGRRAATAEERDEAAARLDLYARDDEALARRLREEIPTPDSIPAIHGIVFSDDGELLVQTTLPLGDRTTHDWDVFDREGAWLGTLSLPSSFLVREVGPDYVLGIRVDEMNVPFVQMYRLDRQ